MEKVRPWCGQPSDRRRLKNRTEQGSTETSGHCNGGEQAASPRAESLSIFTDVHITQYGSFTSIPYLRGICYPVYHVVSWAPAANSHGER